MGLVTHGLGRAGAPQSTQGLGGPSAPFRHPNACALLQLGEDARSMISLSPDGGTRIPIDETAVFSFHLSNNALAVINLPSDANAVLDLDQETECTR